MSESIKINQENGNEMNGNGSRAWYIQIASTFGVPTAILGALMWGLWVIISWLGVQATEFKKDVVIPLVAKHMDFLKVTTESISAMEATTERIGKSLGKHEEAIAKNQTAIEVNQGLIRDGTQATQTQIEEVRKETVQNRTIYLENLENDRQATKQMIDILKSIDSKAGSIDAKTLMP